MMKSLIPALLCFLFTNCTQETQEKKAEPKPVDTVKKTEPVVVETPTLAPIPDTNNIYNNITAVLSGYKNGANELNYLFDTVAWAEHAKYVESSWQKLEKKRMKAMREWAKEEFAAVGQTKTVFYPFSGPDYLTVNAFFPDADQYIMLGLEPVGKLPELGKFKPGDAREYSEDFKKSLGDIFEKSYFITKKMLSDFQRQKVNGLLPVLAFFIKRSGNEILDVKYLMRYHQDSISEVAYTHEDPERKPFGVRVDFLQDGKQKSVYYFKYDVSNKLFNDTTVFYKYIDGKTKNSLTYIKSASYLLHAGFMSNMKDLILRNSVAVIQDDTGIPFKYFEEGNNYEIQLYGKYTKPVSDFTYLKMQEPLQNAFKRDSASVKQLPFHLGYHWGSKKDVIIYARKK